MDVFISYSRKDKEFVQILHKGLSQSRYDAWVDWLDIPHTANWWKEIEAGIEAAHTFIFVISPDSLASKVCKQEIDHAAKHNKRLIPIVRRDKAQEQVVHPDLSELNWLFFREGDDFESAFQCLIQAIDSDLNYVRAHTRLLVRAVEWDGKQRNASFLLRGSDLDGAEQWLLQTNKEKEPKPTELQRKYIAVSRQSAAKRKRLIMAGITLFWFATAGLAGIGFIQFIDWQEGRRLERREAVNSEVSDQSREAEDLLASNQDLEALIAGITLGRQIQENQTILETPIRMQAIAALRQVVYGVRDPKRLEGHGASISSTPDGQALASASADNPVKLWNHWDDQLNTLEGHSEGVNSISFSSDGQTFASASYDGTINLWDRQGNLLNTFVGHDSWVSSVSISPDGQTLASASKDKTIKLWDRQGNLLNTFVGHDSWVNGVSFSPDGQTLASASADNTVKLWDRQGNLLNTLKAFAKGFNGVSFSPDGQTIAAAGVNNTVKLWDRQGNPLTVLVGHDSWVNSISFSPDSQTLASASADNTVKLWDRQGNLLNTLEGHRDDVWSVSFSPDGETIASASSDKTIKLWDRQGNLLSTLGGHISSVLSVGFSPDGQTIVSGSYDQTVKLWNFNLNALLTRGCHWLQDYITLNPEVALEERQLCENLAQESMGHPNPL